MSRPAQLLAMLALLVALAGCSGVLSSYVAKPVAGAGGDRACRDGKAAYYLPKRLALIEVTGGQLSVSSPPVARAGTTAVFPSAAADTRYGPFCLGYKGSAFADDKLSVSINAETSLLEAIKFNSDDKTADIAIDFIEAIGDFAAFVAAERGLEELQPVTTAGPFVVDLFDERRMREVNRTLRQAGYCVFLDGRADAFVSAWSNAMCAHTGYPQVAAQTAGLRAVPADGDLRAFQNAGVLYRPLLSHKLVVMQQRDGQQWDMVKTQHIQLPNAAPAFLLHVDRSWIGDSKTVIAFDRGTPYDVQLSKQSELSVFIDIPLSVVQVAVSIPLKALSFGTAEAQNQTRLIQVNAELIDTLEKYEAARDADLVRAMAAMEGVPGAPATPPFQFEREAVACPALTAEDAEPDPEALVPCPETTDAPL